MNNLTKVPEGYDEESMIKYTLRKYNSKVLDILDYPKDIIIKDAEFVGNSLIIRTSLYVNYTPNVHDYDIIYDKCESDEWIIVEGEKWDKLKNEIILEEPPENYRNDIFTVISALMVYDYNFTLLAFDWLSKNSRCIIDSADIKIINVDLDDGNTLIKIYIPSLKKYFLLSFTTEELLYKLTKGEVLC